MLDAMPSPWKTVGLLVCAGLFPALASACAPKEAADPHSMLGDLDGSGSEGHEGASEEPKPAAGPPPKLATRLECEAAARRIEELALELAVKDADESSREELEARRAEELKSEAFKGRVEEGTKACLARETTSGDARCVARARSEMDVDRCGQR
jgi:hypothetical protein